MTSTGQLTAERLIEALAAGKTATEAAAEVGVSVSTVYRYMRDATFRASVSARRGDMWAPDAELLRSEVRNSIRRLIALRDSPLTHDSTQLRASIAIIELATQIKKITDDEPRLAAIEDKLNGTDASTEA
ncbi:hypothetical protein VT84_30765 [Gemmata sp. SH-PL17]|uniref:helix-turn-helix domain-containing protein n=1 Tax=Gemmata sp. SH-PL17 TaxID=1630693 RepID=UPI00078DC079|nr:helix-turn-helix domain-containing protein [Gemmata sp. SH-PL17]AMV28816.1 hypothetical protein VT84_30765 [Gemmata sp. SH-PL17]